MLPKVAPGSFWVGAIVALAQVFVILSFSVGWFLISPSLTDAQLANGEGGFHFSHVTGWAQDSSAYAMLLILIGVRLAPSGYSAPGSIHGCSGWHVLRSRW